MTLRESVWLVVWSHTYSTYDSVPSLLTSPTIFRCVASEPFVHVMIAGIGTVTEYAGGTMPSAMPPSAMTVTGWPATWALWLFQKHAVIDGGDVLSALTRT